MDYTIQKLAQMAGISTRTLRYYDQIGLLSPARISSNGYRIYGKPDVDVLQQILFYRELGVPLEEIGRILHSPGYNREKCLNSHLTALLEKRKQIDLLIHNVINTIRALKGDAAMSDKEKFEGLKDKRIRENEAAYGKELRKNYGDDAIEASNKKLSAMDEKQWEALQELSVLMNNKLKKACEQGEPESPLAQEVCELHRQWLCSFWKEGSYSPEAHLALAQMYCDDERFKAYYDAVAPGAASFLQDALIIYCRK